MYLEKVKSKGNYYVYLKQYDRTVTYSHDKRVYLYSFGRIDKALNKMYEWKKDSSRFPGELLEIGCGIDDVKQWIKRLEKHKKVV